MGEEEGEYSADTAVVESAEPEPEAKPKKKSWRDNSIDQVHSPTDAFRQKRLFPTADDVLKQSMEKSKMGLGGNQSLLKPAQGLSGTNKGAVVPHLTESMLVKKIQEKSGLYSGGARTSRMRPRAK